MRRTSLSGVAGAPNHAPYGAAKAGLNSMVRSLAAEYGKHGIRVNAVAPGAIETEAVAAWRGKGESASKGARIPLGRRGVPDEIARAVHFFASPMSDYVTGQTLLVDGGATVGWPLADDPPGTVR